MSLPIQASTLRFVNKLRGPIQEHNSFFIRGRCPLGQTAALMDPLCQTGALSLLSFTVSIMDNSSTGVHFLFPTNRGRTNKQSDSMYQKHTPHFLQSMDSHTRTAYFDPASTVSHKHTAQQLGVCLYWSIVWSNLFFHDYHREAI